MIEESREEYMAKKKLEKEYMKNTSEFDDSEENWVPDTIDSEIDENDYLTEAELANMNFFAERHKVFEKDSKILELKLQMVKIQEKLMDTKKEVLARDRMIIEYNVIQESQKQNDFKQSNREFLETVSKNHNIDPDVRWGFNPESGKIVKD